MLEAEATEGAACIVGSDASGMGNAPCPCTTGRHKEMCPKENSPRKNWPKEGVTVA